MSLPVPRADRPEIAAATRGGDRSLGMNGEANLGRASLAEALAWTAIYREVATLEDAVLAHVQHLTLGQTRQARRELELTTIPVVVAQAARFRSRLALWESRAAQLQCSPEVTVDAR